MTDSGKDDMQYACGLCNAPLNSYTTSQFGVQISEEWRHPPGTNLDGHDPLPIAGGKVLASESVCDVCSARSPVWAYPTRSAEFEMQGPDGPGEVSVQVTDLSGGWAVCGICARLIEGRDIKSMVKRAMVTNPSMRNGGGQVPPMMRAQMKADLSAMLTDVYKRFFTQITGPREPMDGK